MVTTFICSTKDCPNEGIAYNMEGELKTCQCGGCGTILKPEASE